MNNLPHIAGKEPGADNRLDSLKTSTSISNLRNENTTTPQKVSYSRIVKPQPHRKQAILLPTVGDTPLIDYIITIGRLIGPKKIISASKISKKRICVYLENEKTADEFIQLHQSITVNGQEIKPRKLVAPSRKLILSNVHSCIPNSVLLDELQRSGIKVISTIFELHIGTSSENYEKSELDQYTHISSFRRGVYIMDEDSIAIPNSLLFQYEGETYHVFVNDNELRCHICNNDNAGHNAAQCMEEDFENYNTSILTDQAPEQQQNQPLQLQKNFKRPHSIATSTSSLQHTTSETSDQPAFSPCPLQQLTSDSGEKKGPCLEDSLPPAVSHKKKKTRTKKLKIETTETQVVENTQASTKELLKPIEEKIQLLHTQKHYKLNFTNFALLMDAIKGKGKTEDVKLELQHFTDILPELNLKEICVMLDENYQNVSRAMKYRFTKLRKHILKLQPELATSFASYTLSSSDHQSSESDIAE